MSAAKLKEIYTDLLSLAVFPKLLEDSVVLALCEFLCAEDDTDARVSEYANFVSKVFSCGTSFAKHLQNLVNDDENVYMRTIGAGKTPSAALEKAVNAELDILQDISEITPELLKANIDYSGYLPDFDVEKVNIPDEYRYRCDNVNRFGYGIYSKYKMFYLDDERRIVPVKNPDSITLSELIDYKNEQAVILENTVALLNGKPAANILLTGDAGTGKSSTIKAVANELYGKGLRILEVRKEQLYALPEILDQLSENPLKFIIFVDDLSFREDDDNFGALKAILEGSVSARSGNVVIYATSNRRHLVKETFSGREGDDVHRNDTMQEILSLSARFGIHLSFYKPNRETYLHIVTHLAEEKGIFLPKDEMYVLAERFALEKGGRSARAAKQFVDSLITKQ
ncbi:MAG: ATP-binding protein [Ruminococcaceae bacterium]|nr:ATP-binding protein [Oscillospiraceae bacterium]